MKNNLKYLLIVVFCLLGLVIYYVIINIGGNKLDIIQINNCVKGSEKQLDSLKEQLLLAEKNNDTEKIISSSVIIGNCLRQNYIYDNSLAYFLKAYQLKDEINDYRLLANITYKIALNYLELGDFVNAHKFALKTDSIEKIHRKTNAETLNLLGSIYEKSGLFVKSLNDLHQSIELQKSAKNSIGLANSYHNVAHIYMQAEKYEQAYEYYTNALEIYNHFENDRVDSVENQVNTAKIYLSLGNYYNAQNDTANAIGYLRKASSIFDKSRNRGINDK